MPIGITPEEERRRQEQERRYQKAEDGAWAAWQRGLENEREAAEALEEEKKTRAGKRRVSFDSSRNQTYLLYSFSPQLDHTPAQSTHAGEPSDELLNERYELLVKEIASLRSVFAEEAITRKSLEHEAARMKYEAAWKEQEHHRQKAAEEAHKAKEAEESVLARIQREGEAARRKYEEALKRGLENEGQFTSQSSSQKPEQGAYAPKPSAKQHPPVRPYPLSGQYHTKQDQHGHPTPHQRPSVFPVPVGLPGLPAEPLCSDGAPNISMHEDEVRGPCVYLNTDGSTKPVPLPHDHPHSAPRQSWVIPPASAWKAPTSEPQIAKQKLVIPAMCSYRAGVETPKEQWPLPPTPAHSQKEIEASTPVENEKQKLQRELRETKKKYEELDRLRAELEKKRRTNGPSSVATWQTGCKSIWDDPTKVTSKDVATGHQPDTRQSRKERGIERPNQESSTERNDRSLSRTTIHTQYHEEQEYNSSDEKRKPKLSKAHARAKLLKLELSVGMNPPYIPPTPYWHPSPSPSLPPTPPKRSDASGLAVPGLSTSASNNARNDHWEDYKTPMPPGSWRKDSSENLRGHLKN